MIVSMFFLMCAVSAGVGDVTNCGLETLRWLTLDDEEGVNRHSCLVVSTWRSGNERRLPSFFGHLFQRLESHVPR